MLALLFPDKNCLCPYLVQKQDCLGGTTNHIKAYSINNPVHTHEWSHNFVIPYPYQIEFLCLPVYFSLPWS